MACFIALLWDLSGNRVYQALAAEIVMTNF